MTEHYQPTTTTADTAYAYDDPLSYLYDPGATEASTSATNATGAHAPAADHNGHAQGTSTTSSANSLASAPGDTPEAPYLYNSPTGSTDSTLRDYVPMYCFQDSLCAGEFAGVNRGYLCGAVGYGSLVLCPHCRRVGAI